jgi:hypothetical protein
MSIFTRSAFIYYILQWVIAWLKTKGMTLDDSVSSASSPFSKWWVISPRLRVMSQPFPKINLSKIPWISLLSPNHLETWHQREYFTSKSSEECFADMLAWIWTEIVSPVYNVLQLVSEYVTFCLSLSSHYPIAWNSAWKAMVAAHWSIYETTFACKLSNRSIHSFVHSDIGIPSWCQCQEVIWPCI